MIKKISVLLILVSMYYFSNNSSTESDEQKNPRQTVGYAFEHKISDIQVAGTGVVSRLLEDDNKGSRHQKFILNIRKSHSILIAHNIDLSKRINNIKVGDTVEFYGEYEWNKLGGLIHWTHVDPNGRHQNGWLKHEGVKFQ